MNRCRIPDRSADRPPNRQHFPKGCLRPRGDAEDPINGYGNCGEDVCLNMLSIFSLIELSDIGSRAGVAAEPGIPGKIGSVPSFPFLRRQREGFEVRVLEGADMPGIGEKVMSKMISFVENDSADSS